MTDTTELRKRIKDSGYKLSFIAECLGLSTYGLQLKIENKNEFKTSEVDALCRVLKIESLEEKEGIFFAKKDDYKSSII